MTRPVMLGYQQVQLGTATGEVTRRRRILMDYAEQEGYALAQVYVDADANRPLSSFHALIAQARRDREVSAVAVPTGFDLGSDAFARRELWARLRRETGLPVHVVER